MKIGILLAGTFPDEVRDVRGEYDSVFRTLLLAADPELEFMTVGIEAGQEFPEVTAADGWLVTGSRHGVYETHSWMEPLKDFIHQIAQARVPLIGICFGHQVMAEALGGRAVKSEQGWGLGVQSYAPVATPDWLPDALAAPWGAIAIHQDQVVGLPPEATVLASNAFCPMAALVYGDPERPYGLSVQAHPEYTPELLIHMLEARISKAVSPEVAERAVASLATPIDGAAWGEAMVRFYRRANGAASAV